MSSGIGDLFKKPESGLLILRVSAGMTMIFHGIPWYLGGSAKLQQLGEIFSVYGVRGNAVTWGFAAATIEVFGGVLVTLGVLSRLSSLAIFAVLFTALLAGHPKLTFSSFEDWNLTFVLMSVFLALVLTGPGEYSLSGGGKGGAKKSAEPKNAGK